MTRAVLLHAFASDRMSWAGTVPALGMKGNRLGRIYLTVIMPFHILIVRNCMKRIARASQG